MDASDGDAASEEAEEESTVTEKHVDAKPDLEVEEHVAPDKEMAEDVGAAAAQVRTASAAALKAAT